jgi:hypothetical protein
LKSISEEDYGDICDYAEELDFLVSNGCGDECEN